MVSPSSTPFILPKSLGEIGYSFLQAGASCDLLKAGRGSALLVTSGSLRVEADAKIWIVPAHYAVIAWPTDMLRVTAYRDSDVALVRLGRPMGGASRIVQISPLLGALVADRSGAHNPTHVRAFVLGELYRAEPAGFSISVPTDERIRAVASRIIDHPDDPRTLDMFARQLGLSRRTLLRAFVAETGMSFRQFKRRARILHASTLLATGASVQEAATNVGYENVSAFISAFSVVMGTTPGKYFTAPKPALADA